MNNMHFYNAARSVPQGAVKPIKGGAYGAAGLSDINPQWRIERMTELFGPCGIGWDFIPEYWFDNGVCHAHVTVSYKCDGEWSRPVHGYGGTKVGNKDDSDIIKSSVTDALSNALRYIGIGADVWYKPSNTAEQNQFDSKYSAPPQTAPAKPAQQPQTAPAQSGTVQMATAEQLRYIKDRAEDDQYMALMSRYGTDLERLTYSMAQKAIDRINGGAA